ncbi:MAG: hypothetical protein E7369_01635 [Clostridiales bacterium]|nr:hypothetical protein [Clostridiales bacterium]
MKKERLPLSFIDSLHRDGKIWGFSLFAVIFLFPLIMCIIFHCVPNWEALGKGLLAVMPMYWAVAIIEVITYVPMLGAGGAYLSFVTGNISNLKLPCALNAMELAGVKPSTEEGEIISTISIAVSSIVTTIIIIIGICFITPLTPLLQSEALSSAFNQILPALFGGLGVVFISKNLKLALPPVILMLILFVAIPALNEGTVGIMVPVGVIFTLIIARIMYKKGII